MFRLSWTARRAVTVFPVLGILFLVATTPFRAAADTLSVDRAQALALSEQPLLESKYAAIDSARELSISARELPDPKLKFGFVNVPIEGSDALSLTSQAMTMTTVGVMQTFPRADKRRLRSELLQLEGTRSVNELAVLEKQIRRDTALAWVDTWTAERSLTLLNDLKHEWATEIEALAISLRNNLVSAADVFAARVQFELLNDREQMLTGERHVARAALARWIGDHADAELPQDFPSLPSPPPADAMLSKMVEHSHIAIYDIQTRIADADARLADLSRKPDWSMELAYGKRGSQHSDMVSLQFQIDLPVLQARRQNHNIAAKFASAQQARDSRENHLRDMRARAKSLYALWEVANRRAETYAKHVVPEGKSRLQAALAAYRGGKGGLSEVLAARRGLLDLQLDALRRQADLARSAFALEYFAHTMEAKQ